MLMGVVVTRLLKDVLCSIRTKEARRDVLSNNIEDVIQEMMI